MHYMPGNYFSLTLFCREEEGLFYGRYTTQLLLSKKYATPILCNIYLWIVLFELTIIGQTFSHGNSVIVLYDLTSGDAQSTSGVCNSWKVKSIIVSPNNGSCDFSLMSENLSPLYDIEKVNITKKNTCHVIYFSPSQQKVWMNLLWRPASNNLMK